MFQKMVIAQMEEGAPVLWEIEYIEKLALFVELIGPVPTLYVVKKCQNVLPL